MRFLTHNDQFLELRAIWKGFEAEGALNEFQTARLEEIERRDSIFPEIDPGLWAAGAAELRKEDPAAERDTRAVA